VIGRGTPSIGLLSILYCSTLSTQSVVGRLALERRVWNDSIVLVYVEVG